jgi:hypothetical protein
MELAPAPAEPRGSSGLIARPRARARAWCGRPQLIDRPQELRRGLLGIETTAGTTIRTISVMMIVAGFRVVCCRAPI